MEVDGEENGVPRALEDGDDAEGKVEARRVVFERRREKASKIKVRKGQKPPKDRDWVLKKKEVRPLTEHWPLNDRCSYSHRSFTDSEERRVYLMTRSIPVGNDGLFSDAHFYLMSRSSCVLSRVAPKLNIHLNIISYHSIYLILPKSGVSRLARMRSRLLLTLQPLATDLTLEVKCRRICELFLLPQLGCELLRGVEDGSIRDGKLGCVELDVREQVRVWRERHGVVVDSGVKKDHALVLR